MKHILVPIDFSDCATNAARFAVETAIRYDSAITFFHAVHMPMIDPNMPPDMVNDMMEEGEKQARESYNEFKRGLDKIAQLETEFELRTGFVSTEILNVAKEKEADYILMGTHGASGIRSILGSITASIVQKADIPVFAIPIKSSFNEFRNIVYATDLNMADVECLDQLLDFNKHVQAKITVVHISTEKGGIDNREWDELKSAFWKEIKMEEIEFALVESDGAAHGLEQYLKEHKPDLVAMLTKHRSFLNRIFNPSLTKHLAMHTEVPLLAFHT